MSSADGLAIFRKWKTQQTVLWAVTVDRPDDAAGPEVRIKEVSDDPPGIVLSLVGISRSETSRTPGIQALDLAGAIFDDARPPRFALDAFVRFLSVRLPDGRKLLFVELRPEPSE